MQDKLEQTCSLRHLRFKRSGLVSNACGTVRGPYVVNNQYNIRFKYTSLFFDAFEYVRIVSDSLVFYRKF